MRTKSAYKTPAPNIPQVEVNGEPAAGIGLSVENAEPVEATVAAIEPATPDVDEATAALMRQLQSFRQSEELQRQHAQQMAQRQRPMTRIQFLQSQGLTEAEAKFFDSREDISSRRARRQQKPSLPALSGTARSSSRQSRRVSPSASRR